MRTRYRKILVAAGAALASMALLASAADAATPAPPYEDFAGCPSRAENPFIAECIKWTFSGGHVDFGNREVPVTNPIVLRGGSEQITSNFISNNEGGIVPVKQTVPGGLIGLTGLPWLDEALGSKEQLKLYAMVELAGNPGTITEFPLVLPIKIHLQNQALGSNCYIGSNANPITLDLVEGKPFGEFEREAGRPEVLVTSGELVDSSYAVPGASGCQLKIGPFNVPIDELVDAAYELPAARGTDTTALTSSLSLVEPEVVYP